MFKKLFVLLLVVITTLAACKKEQNQETIHKQFLPESSNIFSDNPLLIKVLQAIENADTAFIKHNLRDTNPKTRYFSVLALASIQDSSNLYLLVNMLNDSSENVRIAAAYTISLFSNPDVQDILIKQYYNERSPLVRAQLLEAIGKCGTQRSLYFISRLTPTDKKEYSGLARALVYFAIRNIHDEYSDQKALQLLTDYQTSNDTKQIVSAYFTQPGINTKKFYKQLIHIYHNSDDVYLKANLIKAIGKNHNEEVFNFLVKQLHKQSSEVQIAAAQALSHQDKAEVPRLMIKLINHPNLQVNIIAANYFVYHGLEKEANYYFEIARQIPRWQPRSLMLHAALKYAPDSLKEKIAQSIISGFNVTKNNYEKAALLSAMGFYPYKYEFIRNQIFYSDQKIISTTAIKTLVKMRLQPDFNRLAIKYKEEEGFDLHKEFALIFKEVMRKGDNAQIFYSAKIFKNKNLHIIDDFENTFFMNQALGRLRLPRDIRVYKSLCSLLQMYTGDTSCLRVKYNLSLTDWNFAKKIDKNIRVRVKTTKGDFVMELYPEKAPVAVSSFLENVINNYYNGTYIFRTVPNKSVWISSRRGDGWPDLNIVHRVSPYPDHFEAGTVAMQLIDKNLESVQWFIALSPAPEMDGKYTAFGKVIQGLDIVKKLTVGDKVINVEIYR